MSPTDPRFNLANLVSDALGLPRAGVRAVLDLIEEGATVPFIARYRKERTGELDEVQIRDVRDRAAYFTELEERRQTILQTIDEQGKLTDALRARILAADTKVALEDLYLPYRPKRRTRAQKARERGLEPLGMRVLAQPRDGRPEAEARAFVDPERDVPDVEAALAGARDIAAEIIAEEPDLRAWVRRRFARGTLSSRVVKAKAKERSKFETYYEHDEPVASVPSHRYLAMRRGESEGFLRITIVVDDEAICQHILARSGYRESSPFAEHLQLAVDDGYKRLFAPSIERDVRVELKARADAEAVRVFASNLENLLLAPPLGEKPVIGIDPGFRTGCKCVALDATGKLLQHITIYPTGSKARVEQAKRELTALLQRHSPRAVAVGNGTAGRETEAFVRALLKEHAIKDVTVVSVNESGASIYSASDIAREEFPDLDLTIRGAISIARRLQDPLAELVKLDPKVIGVGQYQHDVQQSLLHDSLDAVVESCVNRVGVELNTASAPLLSHVAGIRSSVAHNIVTHREDQGAFTSRAQLLEVRGLGPRTFEQAAGFLRVRASDNPLDASAVHPERYDLVARIASDLDAPLAQLVGNATLAARIPIQDYISDAVGEPTLRDIQAELEKPGRDPRDAFEAVRFRDDVHELEDLEVGMRLQGIVTNVTNFGAFVDVGVHQDGLIHISKLADHFVKDPHDVIKVGDRVSVRVLDVDLQRRRISLSARSEEADAPRKRSKNSKGRGRKRSKNRSSKGRGHGKGRRSSKGGGRKRSKGGDFSNNPFSEQLRD